MIKARHLLTEVPLIGIKLHPLVTLETVHTDTRSKTVITTFPTSFAVGSQTKPAHPVPRSVIWPLVKPISPVYPLDKLALNSGVLSCPGTIPSFLTNMHTIYSLSVASPVKTDDFSTPTLLLPLLQTVQQIDLIHNIIAQHPKQLALAERADDIIPIFRSGRVASLIGVEGLHQIANSMSVLRMYHKLGVRYVTLCHDSNTKWADAAVRHLHRLNEANCHLGSSIQQIWADLLPHRHPRPNLMAVSHTLGRLC